MTTKTEILCDGCRKPIASHHRLKLRHKHTCALDFHDVTCIVKWLKDKFPELSKELK